MGLIVLQKTSTLFMRPAIGGSMKQIGFLVLIAMALSFLGCPPVETTSDAKDMTAFTFTAAKNSGLAHDVACNITGNNIVATVPFGTNVEALVSTFTTTGASVKIGNVSQVSGTTANDFTNPVTYTVTAEDGSTLAYTITVTITPEPVEPEAVTETSLFQNPIGVGDHGAVSFANTEESFEMILAKEDGNQVLFPYDEHIGGGDFDDGETSVTTQFWIAETEFTNAQAELILEWAWNNLKFTNKGDPSGPYSANATTARHGGKELIDFDAVDDDNNLECRLQYDGSGKYSVVPGYENHPLTNVTWFGAIVLCNWLTEMRDGNTDNVVYTGITGEGDHTWDHTDTVADPTKNGYRLPTSQEWEYAARYRGSDSTNTVAGYTDPYFTKGHSLSGATTYFNDTETNNVVAVTSGSVPKPDDEAMVRSLGPDSANTLGLYDMSGNVWEWCFTLDADDHFRRIFRGGSWFNLPSMSRISLVSSYSPSIGNAHKGFRLARSAD